MGLGHPGECPGSSWPGGHIGHVHDLHRGVHHVVVGIQGEVEAGDVPAAVPDATDDGVALLLIDHHMVVGHLEHVDLRVVVQDLLDLLRKTLKLGNKILITPLGNTSAHQRKLNGKAIAGNQLSAVGFRCGNCNLRTGKGIKYIICFPGNGASHHIDNSKGFQPLLFCKTECCKAVCRLSGLADDNDQTFWI